MTTLGSKSKEVSEKIQKSQSSQTRLRGVDRDKMQDNMKKRMQKKQQDRRRKSGDGKQLLGEYAAEKDVYQTNIPDDLIDREDLKQDIQIEADMTDAMVAIMHVLDEHERQQDQSNILRELESSLQGKLAGESDAIISAYTDSVAAVSKKLCDEKSRASAEVAARLAARKRLREELYNKQVNEEVINEVGLAKVRPTLQLICIIVNILS